MVASRRFRKHFTAGLELPPAVPDGIDEEIAPELVGEAVADILVASPLIGGESERQPRREPGRSR